MIWYEKGAGDVFRYSKFMANSWACSAKEGLEQGIAKLIDDIECAKEFDYPVPVRYALGQRPEHAYYIDRDPQFLMFFHVGRQPGEIHTWEVKPRP